MARLKRGCIWLLGLVAFAWSGTAFLRNLEQSKQYQALQSDIALDRKFNARSPTPLEVSAMISTSNGNYQVPADLPSFHHRIKSLGKIPAIIVLPGCAFAVRGKNVPLNVVVLSIDENRNLITAKTSLEACMSRDAISLQQAIERQLKFALNYVQSAKWIDRKRIMIVGAGEAAPIIAAYDGPVKPRLTVGDPCLVPWKNIDRNAPLLMLFTWDRRGLAREDERSQPLDIAAIVRGAAPPLPPAKACIGLERPRIQPPVRQVIAQGQLGMVTMPAALEAAQKAAYDGL